MTRNPDITATAATTLRTVAVPTLLNEWIETHQLIALVTAKNASARLTEQAEIILKRRLDYTNQAESDAHERFYQNRKQHVEQIADLNKRIASLNAQLAELQNTARAMDRTIMETHNVLDVAGVPRQEAVSTPIGIYAVNMTVPERTVALLEVLAPYKRRFDFLNDMKQAPRWRCEVDDRGVLLFDLPATSQSGMTYPTLEKAVDAAILKAFAGKLSKAFEISFPGFKPAFPSLNTGIGANDGFLPPTD